MFQQSCTHTAVPPAQLTLCVKGGLLEPTPHGPPTHAHALSISHIVGHARACAHTVRISHAQRACGYKDIVFEQPSSLRGRAMGLKAITAALAALLLLQAVQAHVVITYPPARNPRYDYLDNYRTGGPCGVAGNPSKVDA